MPVRKFRGVEEMEDSVWYPAGDPKLFRAIAAVWDFANRTVPKRYPRGVYKHRSIEEMNLLDEVWERENFQAFQHRRSRSARGTAGAEPAMGPGRQGTG